MTAQNIAYNTALMKNQKYASVMDPHRQFDALQTPDGYAVFFSISPDGIFYITQELPASPTGWLRVNLSAILGKQIPGNIFTVSDFDVAQNPQSADHVDLALVVRVADSDRLFIALDQPNNLQAWQSGVNWVYVPYDCSNREPALHFHIADVYLMNMPGIGSTCFVDVIRRDSSLQNLLDRFYINMDVAPHWWFRPLPDDISAGSVRSFVGKRAGNSVGGIYTFGFVGSQQKLIYSPAPTPENPFPPDAHLEAPDGVSGVASVQDAAGNTNLFAAVPQSAGIVIYTPDNQNNNAQPQWAVGSLFIFQSRVLMGTSHLEGATTQDRTALWGLNGAGEVFSLSCPAGQETNLSAWTNPVPICFNVLDFAPYLNLQASNRVLFMQTSDDQLIQLTQDPETSIWAQRSILLPPDTVSDLIEYQSYTTHLQVTDENAKGVPNCTVSVTASSPVSAYLNDVYHILDPDTPVETTTTVTGDVTLIQETQTALLKDEESDIRAMVKELQDCIINSYSTLTVTQIVVKFTAIMEKFLLETAENGILALLEVLKLAAREAIDFLDAPLDIPILTPMYRSITGGSPFTFLDMTCLVCAIPATVIYKFMANTTPFPDNELTQQLITAPTWDSLVKVIHTGITPEQQRAAWKKWMPEHAAGRLRPSPSGVDLYTTIVVVSNIAAAASTLPYISAIQIKSDFPKPKYIPPPVRYLAIGFYIGYVMPDLLPSSSGKPDWETDTNWAITEMSLVKTMVDNSDPFNTDEADEWCMWISPLLEVFVNGVWVVPAAFELVHHHSKVADWVGGAGNLCFDLGGIVSVFMASEDPKEKLIATAAYIALNVAYGGCCIGMAECLVLGW